MGIPQQAVFCHKCGRPFEQMQQFCTQCGGKRFSAPLPMAVQPTPVMINTPPPMAVQPAPAMMNTPPPMAVQPTPVMINTPPPMGTVALPRTYTPPIKEHTPLFYKIVAIFDILIGAVMAGAGILSLINDAEPLALVLGVCLGGITCAAGIVCAIQSFTPHIKAAGWVKIIAIVCAGMYLLVLIYLLIINVL